MASVCGGQGEHRRRDPRSGHPGPRRARPPDNGGGQVGELLGQEPEGEHEDHGRAVGVHSRARIAQGEEEEELDGDDHADRPHGQTRDPRRGQGEESGPGAAHGVVDPCGDEAHKGCGGDDQGDEQVAGDDVYSETVVYQMICY